MKTSDDGVKFIAAKERMSLKAYKAAPTEKYWTIGVGHYGADVIPNSKITEAQAYSLFKSDLKTTENYVSKLVKVSLNQNQFDALVSFVFNRGVGNFNKTRLLKHLNQGRYDEAAKDFTDPENWNFKKFSERVRQSLYKRRKEEQNMFCR